MELAKPLQNIKPSYIREILSAASAPGVISLAGGLPDDVTFPLALMERSIKSLPQKNQLFQYGNTAGYQPLLQFFKHTYQLPRDHDGIVCTGSQQALDLIARAFINPGDEVIMEAPSYLGAIQVFSLVQAKICSVIQNNTGPDLQALETAMQSKNAKFFYAVPDFHNPTGVCWSLAVRQEVGRLCRQYNVTLIEDVPYRELRFSGNALPLVSSFCPNNSLVLRSFSKIATPGIRLGLVTGQEKWLSAINTVKQAADLHSSIPMQAVLLDLLQHDKYEEHLQNLRQLYQSRYEVLCESIALKLPKTCQLNNVAGGMFVWLRLPECNVDTLAESCLSQGVAVVPSSVFYQNKHMAIPALRLNFTNATEEALREAIDRLAVILHKAS